LCLAPKAAWMRRRRILLGLGSGAAVAAAVLAYPLVFLLAGRQHVSGPPWPGQLGIHLSYVVTPVRASHAVRQFAQLNGYFGVPGPDQSFLGIGLLVVLAAAIPLLLRRREAGVLALVGGAAWVCALGPFLVPLTSEPQWWLIWRYVNHTPLLENIGPTRFPLVTTACAAVLLALALDRFASLAAGLAARTSEARSASARRLGLRAGSALVVAGALAAAAVPLASTYELPLTMHSGVVPAWFRQEAPKTARPTYLLAYPYASSPISGAMYWQAVEGLPFALVGGRALIPGQDGRHSQHVDPFTGTDVVLSNASFGGGVPPTPTPSEVHRARLDLSRWHVQSIVVVAEGRDPAWAVLFFEEGTGIAPQLVDGAAVWDRVGPLSSVSSLFSASEFGRCAAQPISSAGISRAVGCARARA
ncbi:MAG: hypothetical protein ACRDZP_09015, partial [Acidimicrobiales bacterium]